MVVRLSGEANHENAKIKEQELRKRKNQGKGKSLSAEISNHTGTSLRQHILYALASLMTNSKKGNSGQPDTGLKERAEEKERTKESMGSRKAILLST